MGENRDQKTVVSREAPLEKGPFGGTRLFVSVGDGTGIQNHVGVTVDYYISVTTEPAEEQPIATQLHNVCIA